MLKFVFPYDSDSISTKLEKLHATVVSVPGPPGTPWPVAALSEQAQGRGVPGRATRVQHLGQRPGSSGGAAVRGAGRPRPLGSWMRKSFLCFSFFFL